jgi:small nuclear ribonucleoprotein
MEMVNGVERPLDLLNQSKGKEILLYLKNNKQLVGKLLAFDIHINIVLDNTRELEDGEIKRSIGMAFVRGDTIIYISPAPTV